MPWALTIRDVLWPLVEKISLTSLRTWLNFLIEDDKIWVDIFINSKMEEHWNDAGYSKYRTIESMFNEWKMYQKLTKIRIENGIQEPEVAPFLFYHDYLEVDVSAESWQHLFKSHCRTLSQK